MSEINQNDLIKIRRHLHQYPELALHEFKTHDYILKIIKSFNQNFLEIKKIPILPTAILVYVKGSQPQRTLGYRADIDALPVEEQTNLTYKSKNPGVMHACGHDIHITVALGILNYFSEHQPLDNLIFFFQPAEESQSGGKLAYEAGVFKGKWRPDEFYGLHVNPNLKTGEIGCRMGTLFAGTTELNITLTGKQGHAAFPHKANDMVVAAANLIIQIQTIISRSINPIDSGVITLGKIQAGAIRNVIAGTAHIEGTIRGLNQSIIEKICSRLHSICDGIAESFNCEANLELNQGGYLPVKNDPQTTRLFIDYLSHNPRFKFVETAPAMTGEDFGYLLSKIPGTMFWLGVDSKSQLHSSTLKPNESAIVNGIEAVISFFKYRMTK